MATLFRALRLYGLTVWVGGLIFFVVVAGIAFKVLPDAHTAGLVVRNSLIAIHRIGFAAAVLYILATLALLATRRDSHMIRLIEMALAVMMLALTIYSQMSIIPHMETDRITLGGDVDKAPFDAPPRKHFEHLHSLSVKVESIVLIEGLALIALAPIYGEDERERELATRY